MAGIFPNRPRIPHNSKHLMIQSQNSRTFKKYIYFILTEDILIDFGEGRERENERERNINVREKPISRLSHVPQLGTKPSTQVCAPTGN